MLRPVARAVRRVARAVRRVRHAFARSLLRIATRLDRGVLPAPPPPPATSWGVIPIVHKPRPAPEPLPAELPPPPVVEEPMHIVRTILPVVPRIRYDVDLFEQLNAEYASRPLVPEPRRYDHEAMLASAIARLRAVHRATDLRDKTVLEIGCGGGYELWYAASSLGADAWGIDVVERRSWEALAGERVHLQVVDMAASNPFAEGTFDRAMSFTAWEHIEHPYRMLVETHRVLRPGGLFWMKANLHRGPQASHLYRHILFPFPTCSSATT